MQSYKEKLLEIPFSETIDFSKYIIQGETWLNIKDFNGIEPEVDIKITRYLKNKFAIYIKFYTALSDDDNDYSGVIEFSFDLDDYLTNEEKVDSDGEYFSGCIKYSENGTKFEYVETCS